VLARAGFATTLLEAQSNFGGGMRCAELTIPGFVHDVCSAVHPLAVSSPIFQSCPLEQHGLKWIYPAASFAHPLDDGSAVVIEKSVEETADRLGRDRDAWRRAFDPMVRNWHKLAPDILGPVQWPRHPVLLARFGMRAPWPATLAARVLFQTEAARAAFAGAAAHSIMPLESVLSGAFGWVLTIAAHAVGWPIPSGGSQAIAIALLSYFASLGGTVAANTSIRRLRELNDADIVLLDITPRQFLDMAGEELPADYRHRLEAFRYGPGVFKMDWALNGPIPWTAPACAKAATVHLGGTLSEIAQAERAPFRGEVAERPFVLLVQPSLFDPSRAPAGRHTAWAYCHVPNGSAEDVSATIEKQIERFAPGFRSQILARSILRPADLQRHNANLQGGDINGGEQSLTQFLFRPTRSLYRTPLQGVYLCSSSTPPGGGVHGMCGYHAARCALDDLG
jgi:phytoene dehydrogenase-like protein